jgi:hypothetical protein
LGFAPKRRKKTEASKNQKPKNFICLARLVPAVKHIDSTDPMAASARLNGVFVEIFDNELNDSA